VTSKLFRAVVCLGLTMGSVQAGCSDDGLALPPAPEPIDPPIVEASAAVPDAAWDDGAWPTTKATPHDDGADAADADADAAGDADADAADTDVVTDAADSGEAG